MGMEDMRSHLVEIDVCDENPSLVSAYEIVYGMTYFVVKYVEGYSSKKSAHSPKRENSVIYDTCCTGERVFQVNSIDQ
jgi:hypothetical protein